jgi:beta-galactosidase
MTLRYALPLVGLMLFTYAAAPAQIATLPATFELRTVDGVTVPFQNGMPVPLFEKQRRPTVDLDGSWRKQRFAANHDLTLGLRDSAGMAALLAELAGRQFPEYDDAAWADKILPAVENTMNGVDVRPEDYEDGVYYRRAFTLADSLSGRFARLNFLAVNYVADVWLNGRYLGYHEGGYTSFSFDATTSLRFDTTNVLVVRVDNPPWGSRDDIVPYGNQNHKPDWFNYTGIVHDVYLEFSSSVSIARTGVIPQGLDGTIKVTAALWNRSGALLDGTLTFDVFEAAVDSSTIQAEAPADLIGTLVATDGLAVSVDPDSASVETMILHVLQPNLWSPKHPSLYILRARLVQGTTTLDEQCVQFGIRTVSTKGNTFLLNGKPMFFPGIARHEDHYLYGRAVPDSVIYSDLLKVVDLNVTFLRTAHYPNHPYTYLLADRLGLAVMEEIPLWQVDEAAVWSTQDLYRHIHEQMWREMVFRDRNRPSILLWSTCNECLDQTNRGAFIQRVHAEIDSLFPDGRFVVQSAAADRPGPSDPTQAFCDAAGWTMYFGVFYGGNSYYGGTSTFLLNALIKNQTKPILATEFGYWSTENLGAAALQITVFDETFRAFNQFVVVDSLGLYHSGMPLFATTWWTIFDWCTNGQPTGAQTMGVYKMDHTTIKPVAADIRNTYRPFKMSSETATIQAVKDQTAIPLTFMLEQNYPNPFNPRTVISGQWTTDSRVRLAVYDLLGREVAVLANGRYPAGKHTFTFDGTNLASGVYFYRLTAGANSAARKMLLVR